MEFVLSINLVKLFNAGYPNNLFETEKYQELKGIAIPNIKTIAPLIFVDSIFQGT